MCEPQWQPIETAPKDGLWFVAAYANQGFVKILARWNLLHRHWESQNGWIVGFEANATHWLPLPHPRRIEMKYTPENTAEIDKPVDVYLNGVLQAYVYEADTDEGYISLAALDENGYIQTNAERTEVLKEIKYGFVDVVFKD